MTQLDGVTADAKCRGNWWSISVPEVPGLHTASRTLEEVPMYVRQAGREMGYDIASVKVRS